MVLEPAGRALPVVFPPILLFLYVSMAPLSTKTPVGQPVTVEFERRTVGTPLSSETPIVVFAITQFSTFTSVLPAVPGGGSCALTPAALFPEIVDLVMVTEAPNEAMSPVVFPISRSLSITA